MLSQQTIEQLPKEETIVEKIYRLAEAKDEKALTDLVKQNVCIGVFQGGYNAIKLLSAEGDTKSVDFLIGKFNANRNDAVMGYAMGGHVEQVNQLIAQGVSRDRAVDGYARGGHIKLVNQQLEQGANRKWAVLGYAFRGDVDQVNQLIAQGASRDWAVNGYAKGGHIKQVNQQLEQGADRNFAVKGYAIYGYVEQVNQQIGQGASRNEAMTGYAFGGHVEQVNRLIAGAPENMLLKSYAIFGYAHGGHVEQVKQLLAQGANCHDAVRGYANGGHTEQVNQLIAQGANRHDAVMGYDYDNNLEKENVLRIMVQTDCAELRKLLAEEAKKKDNSLDVNSMCEKATTLIKIQKEYQLDFNQSKALTVKGARTWLFQGQQFVKSNALVSDVFLRIASVVVGLSQYDTGIVLKAVHEKLFKDSVQSIFNNFNLGLFATDQYLEKHHKAEKRYQKGIDTAFERDLKFK